MFQSESRYVKEWLVTLMAIFPGAAFSPENYTSHLDLLLKKRVRINKIPCSKLNMLSILIY